MTCRAIAGRPSDEAGDVEQSAADVAGMVFAREFAARHPARKPGAAMEAVRLLHKADGLGLFGGGGKGAGNGGKGRDGKGGKGGEGGGVVGGGSGGGGGDGGGGGGGGDTAVGPGKDYPPCQ
jgi:hypothetical protein